MYSMQSQMVRKENPTNKPKDPPNSDMNETGGYTRSSFCLPISVDAKLNPKWKYLNWSFWNIYIERSRLLPLWALCPKDCRWSTLRLSHYLIFFVIARYQTFCRINDNFLFIIEEFPIQLFMFRIFFQSITDRYWSGGPGIPGRSAANPLSQAGFHTRLEIILCRNLQKV